MATKEVASADYVKSDYSDDDFTEVVARKKFKSKTSSTTSSTAIEKNGKLVLEMENSILLNQSKQDLLSHLKNLVAYTKLLEGKVSATSSSSSLIPGVDSNAIDSQIDALKKMITKGLKLQLVWKSSCKFGTSTCAFEGFANPNAFTTLFAKKIDFSKKKKSHKLSVPDFCDILGVSSIYQSIRYGSLSLKGDSVNVHWDSSLNQFKITGKYGKD